MSSTKPPKPVAVLSARMLRIPGLAEMLGQALRRVWPWQKTLNCVAVAGWGLRPTATRARALAAASGVPYWALEDGFLRSCGLGVEGYPPWSIVVDELGMYYDATRPSRLEKCVQEVVAATDSTEMEQARQAMGLVVEHGLSKYNHAPDFDCDASGVVLVIDQTAGDMAVQHGGANCETFAAMLKAALAENPDAPVWIKTHPDVLCGKKLGYLPPHSTNPRIFWLGADVNPLSLLRQVARVYAVTSQMGFEALLVGRPVVTFGLPWYAGWGLTDDRHPDAATLAERRGCASLEQLFAAAYLRYTRYLNPATGCRGTVFDVIKHLTRARTAAESLRGSVLCVGFSAWRRAVTRPFLALPGVQLRYARGVSNLGAAGSKTKVVAWGMQGQALRETAAAQGLQVWTMEDGFIRSVGLGANLVPPLSLVLDDLGIYFDPRTPSRLESILATTPFAPADLAEARHLRLALVAARVAKYNVGQGGIALPQPRPARVILVPGQVEDDASIRTGAPWINSNQQLLRQVRAANPDAFIAFKPHPDVLSGHRRGAVPADDLATLTNVLVAEADITVCIDQADEVHTMTSLAGFEALLRGKRVVCYGLPFYAGWGLTEDVFALGNSGRAICTADTAWSRRFRRLTLDELVAGTLIRYPHYVDPATGVMISASRALERLQMLRTMPQRRSIGRGWMARQAGKLINLWHALRGPSR